MNVIFAIILVLIIGFPCFCVDCFANLAKINQLTRENENLKEWLEAIRVCNTELIKENTRLLTDIELISNGKSIIRDED